MKLKKRILGVLLSLLTVVNMLTVPTMAAEQSTDTSVKEVNADSAASSFSYLGTIDSKCNRIWIQNITLLENAKIYLYMPKNNNLDYFQGSVTFRHGLSTQSIDITNLVNDTYVFSNLDAGVWNIFINGSAIGTTRKCAFWFKVVY